MDNQFQPIQHIIQPPKSIWKKIILLVITIVIIVGGIWWYRQKSAIEEFKEAIESGEEGILYQTVRDLKATRDKVLPQLMDILTDTEEPPTIRNSLLTFVLSDIDDERVTPGLIKIIADKTDNRFLRIGSIQLVGRIKDKRAMDTMLSVAQDKEEDSEIREYAIGNLGEVGDETIIDYIIELTYEDDRTFKVPAIVTLGEIISPSGVYRLIELLKSEDMGDITLAAEALSKTNDPRAIQPLIETLKANIYRDDVSDATKGALMDALGALEAKEAVPILIEILNGKDGFYGMMAAENLGKIGDKRAVEPLKEAIEKEKDSYGLEKMKEAYKALTGNDYVAN